MTEGDQPADARAEGTSVGDPAPESEVAAAGGDEALEATAPPQAESLEVRQVEVEMAEAAALVREAVWPEAAAESTLPEPPASVSAVSDGPDPSVGRVPGRAEALLTRMAGRMPAIAVPVNVEAIVLTSLVTVAFLAFLLIEPTPRWLALCASVVAALGTDGVLRSARREVFEAGADTTPYLFLPALFALAAPVFLEYNVTGYWAVPAALGAGVAFGVVVVAEVASVREAEPLRVAARFLAAAATYFVVFALFSLAYAFDLGLMESVIAAALISTLLAVELLRDDQIDALETLVFAGVIGLVAGESRWVLQYMPIDGYLAALTLLLLFYFSTGMAHAYITRQLDRVVTAEYGLVTLIGIALVAGARIAGVA